MRTSSVVGRQLSLLLAISLALAMPPAAACGFHGAMDGNWVPLHPMSLGVAMAVREAADRRQIDGALLDPRMAGPLGYLRATRLLHDLGTRLSGNGALPRAPSMTLLFVEAALWTRYAGTPLPRVHVQGPEAGDVVVVTSEPVIAAILEGRVSAAHAIGRGLVVFDGPAPAAKGIAEAFSRLDTGVRRARTSTAR